MLSAVLKQNNHNVECLTFVFSKLKGVDIYWAPEKYFSFEKISDRCLERNPDVIGFSVYSSNYLFYKHTAEAIRKKSDVPIIVGGVLASLQPELLLKNTCCDFVFRGEAEPDINELVEKASIGQWHNLPNIVYSGVNGEIIYNEMSTFVDNLDDLPFYDKDLYDNSSFTLNLLTSRGCTNACAYCSSGDYTKLTCRGRKKVRKCKVYNCIYEIKNTLEHRKMN